MDCERHDSVRLFNRNVSLLMMLTSEHYRTYPTTYMWFGAGLSGFLPSDQDLGTTKTCTPPADGTDITIPPTADPSSLVAVVGATFPGQNASSTSFVQDPTMIPSSILGYLDTLPEVREQFGNIPITSCVDRYPKIGECTVVETLTSTSCVSGLGNWTRTSCNEELVTVTSTIAMVAAPAPTSTRKGGSLLASRRTAAFLTYNTLPLSVDGAAAVALDEPTSGTKSTPTKSPTRESRPDNSVKKTPSITEEGASATDPKPTVKSGETSHTTDSQPTETAANVGDLLSAIHNVASKASISQGLADASIAQELHSAANEVEPHTGDQRPDDPTDASNVGPSTTVIGSSVSDTTTNALPIFTVQGQTLTAGGAVTFGGNAVSRLPDGDGLVIDDARTVLLANGGATTLSQQDSQKPITISRSGSAFIVNGQTMSPNQETTVGQTTQTVTAGGAVAFRGNAVSQLRNHDGVVVNQDRTVLLSDGGVTTLPQQVSQQPITVSRSGTEFIVNGKTVPANQEITVDQTTASASLSGSSAIVYVGETPVSTISAANGVLSTASTGMGSYINSGIGDGVASASSDGTPTNATDDTDAPSTGDGSRVSLLDWSCGSWAAGLFAFLGVVCLL
jgi:hypothetical protein